MKKFFSSLWVRIKSVVTFFWNHLDRLINIIVLTVSIIALWIAVKSMKNQNSQFEQNSKSSDSLFQVQLKNSSELNDSLVSQLKALQEITNSQLKITDEQFKISKQSFKEQLYSGRPQLLLHSTDINDTSYYDGDIFSPIISTKFSNNGLRVALNSTHRTFLVYPDFSGFRYSIFTSDDYEPESSLEIQFKPKIPMKYKNEFYYCVDFHFYDDVLKREFSQTFYFNYSISRKRSLFDICDNDEKLKLKEVINKFLAKKNEPLFDQ